MKEQTIKFLRYIHQSLADAARLAPSMKNDCFVEITSKELEQGLIGEHARKRLYPLAKKFSKAMPGDKTDEDRLPIHSSIETGKSLMTVFSVWKMPVPRYAMPPRRVYTARCCWLIAPGW